jgi:hypothetical protein
VLTFSGRCGAFFGARCPLALAVPRARFVEQKRQPEAAGGSTGAR